MIHIRKPNPDRYADQTSIIDAWKQWIATPLGRKVLADQQTMLDEILPRTRGYALAVMSQIPPEQLVSASKTSHKWWLSVRAHIRTDINEAPDDYLMPQVLTDQVQWPFEDDSLDVVVLYHSLDFAQWPHQTLREAARCLSASGKLIIVGFNPISTWGAGRLLAGWWGNTVPWMARFISTRRIADWLMLLDCKVVRAYYGRAFLPSQTVAGRWSDLLSLLRLSSARKTFKKMVHGVWPGASYILVCKPEVPSLTPIQKNWKRRQFTELPLVGRSFKGASDLNVRSQRH
jgi:SAM-dependent methyltransferase